MFNNVIITNLLLGAASVEVFPNKRSIGTDVIISHQVSQRLIPNNVFGYHILIMGQWMFFVAVILSLSLLIISVLRYENEPLLHSLLLTLYGFLIIFPKIFRYYYLKDVEKKLIAIKNKEITKDKHEQR